MADSKISALTAVTLPIADTDEFVLATSGLTRKITKLNLASQLGVDGWLVDTATWTYASGSGGGTATFTVSGDVTAKFQKGTRIKLTQTTVKYFVVMGSSFGGGNTTVTIMAGTDYTLANAAISATYYSYALSPQGYPSSFAYNPTYVGWTAQPTGLARFAVFGSLLTIFHSYSSSTSNSTTTSFTLPAGVLAAQTIYGAIRYQNNNTHATTPGMFETANGSNVVTLYTGWSGAAWTASNQKAVGFHFTVPF